MDPTISEGFPIWRGYRNFEDCPSMTLDAMPQGPPRTSTFEDVAYWTSRLSSAEVDDIADDPRILFKKTLFVVCSEWYTLTKYATTRLTQLEWELENPDLLHYGGGLGVTITKLHSWRRRLPIFRTLLLEVLEKTIKRESFVNGSENHVLDLRRDFEILLSSIEDLQVRADGLMAVVTAVMSIEESKKVFEQNRSLARLTWLAVTFIPLSFVSSLFSMNGDLSTLSQSFRIFFAVSIPLTVFVLFLTRYSGSVDASFDGIGKMFSSKHERKSS